MSCGGTTIARALALVTIATGAAFLDWGIRPFEMQLAPPQQDQSDTANSRDGTDPIHTPPDAEEPAGGDTVPAAGFDPSTLGTEIGTADAFALWETGEVTFIDARHEHEYIEGHIPFSFLVPPDSLGDGRLGDMMEFGGVFPDMRVVVYCEGGACDASKLVALNLQDMGFNKIHIDTDGYPGWVAAGHEIETGPDQVLGELP